VCALCVGSIDAASAMDADSQDMGAMQHSLDSGSSSHDGAGGGSGGDALGLSRENVTPSSSSSPSNNENCPTGSQSSPQRKSRTTLGWQSLLPGSLQ
uniref:hypothetical protein n=1 Tax=Dyella sp. ASV21 TaxID=2795114 RepID=UPI001E4B4BF6